MREKIALQLVAISSSFMMTSMEPKKHVVASTPSKHVHAWVKPYHDKKESSIFMTL